MTESLENQKLMSVIDRLYLESPFYGSPRMTLWIKDPEYFFNHEMVERLMVVIGLKAILSG